MNSLLKPSLPLMLLLFNSKSQLIWYIILTATTSNKFVVMYATAQLQKGHPHAHFKPTCLPVIKFIIVFRTVIPIVVCQLASASIVRVEVIVCMSWVGKAPGECVNQMRVWCLDLEI
jgi:hypothetical protein